INDCDDNGNVNLYSTDGSPLVDDCMKMYNNIKGPGSWTVSGGWSNEHQLIQKDTCAFAARSTDGGWLYIGNDDIRLAIVKAMSNNNYKDSKSGRGKVGADGMLSCQSTPGIKWGTLH
ncbi:Ecp2 effector protein, partial [Podospora australis]